MLGTAGGELASVAVALSDEPASFDVIDVGNSVFVHNSSVGQVVRLAAADGAVKDRIPIPTTSTVAPSVVAAGTSVYVVDPSAGTVQHIADSGNRSDVATIGAFDDAVGTSDGRLWVTRGQTGEVVTVTGDRFRVSKVAPANSVLELSAVGDEPVLIDRTASRLRWLLRNATVDPDLDLTTAIVQQPSESADCLAIASSGQLRCFTSAGQLRAMPMIGETVGSSSVLVGNRRSTALLTAGRPEVTLGSWESGESRAVTRPDPSSRMPVLKSDVGSLLIDDPGSPFAFTTAGTRLVPLDKFNRRTVILGVDGEKVDSATVLGATSGEDADDDSSDTDARIIDDGKNDAPIARPDQAVTRSGRAVGVPVIANDSDPDGDIIGVIDAKLTSEAAGRVAVGDLVRVSYTPPDDFVGAATFDYTVTDPGNLRATATVSVNVIPLDVNTAPVTQDDNEQTAAGVPVTIDVLSNDRDAEGDRLTITDVSRPANGSVAALDDNRLRYDPRPGFVGTDEFTYSLIDGFGGEATATVSLKVVALDGANRAPTPLDDRIAASSGKSVNLTPLSNDTDPDGDPLRIVTTSEPDGLTLTIVDGQSIEIQPNETTSGPVQFTYSVEDTAGLRSNARVLVYITSTAANRKPIAVDDRATAPAAATFIDVVANDSDPDGDTLSIVGFEPPAAGSVARTSPTTFRFTPAAGQRGTAQFSYTVSDPGGLTASAKVVVEVIDVVSSDPVAVDDVVEIAAGQTATIAVLANDFHPDRLAFAIVGQPVAAAGSVTVNPNQSISFVPPSGPPATYVFTYTIGGRERSNIDSARLDSSRRPERQPTATGPQRPGRHSLRCRCAHACRRQRHRPRRRSDQGGRRCSGNRRIRVIRRWIGHIYPDTGLCRHRFGHVRDCRLPRRQGDRNVHRSSIGAPEAGASRG